MRENPDIQQDFLKCKNLANKFLIMQFRNRKLQKRVFKADLLLVIELIIITAATYILIYSPIIWYLKLALLIPWGIYSSLTIDNIIHYLNHWNLFKRNRLNILCRGLGVFTYNFILEQKYHHFQHHKYNNSLDDPLTTLKEENAHQTFYEFVLKDIWEYFIDCLPIVKLNGYLRKIKKKKKSTYFEIIITRWLSNLWLMALIFIDFENTLFFYIPFIVILPPIITFTMSLTDHVPGDPYHVFRQATFYQPKTHSEKIVSFLNHYSAATHLTHHLFPQVHWIFLNKLQDKLLCYYQKYNAPKSIVMNSFLVGNPFKLISIINQVKQMKIIKPEM